MRFPLGVVDIVFAPMAAHAASKRAAELGFSHIDTADPSEDLSLPVGDRVSLRPRAGWSTPAPPRGEGMWERAVQAYRRCPGMRVEPWGGSICDSVATVKAILDEVPGLRLLVDTGHVAGWGEDAVELLPWADHVQLRQAAFGVVQRHPDEGGDVDFAAIVRRLDELDYSGVLSVEYFDLPDYGWPLADPVGHAVALADQIRPLLR